MSTESIKKLVQYENEAKEMLEDAYRKYESIIKQAKEDAQDLIDIEIKKILNYSKS